MACSPPGSSVHGISQATSGLGCHFLFQGIFPIQGLNPCLLHCRQILYCWDPGKSWNEKQTCIITTKYFNTPLLGIDRTIRSKISKDTGFPWWFKGEEFAFQCRRHQFDPRWGKSRMLQSNWVHVLQRMHPCATATDQLPRACTCNRRSERNVKPHHCS